MKLKFLIITLFICSFGFSQNKGIISGILTDKDSNNQALPFANVMLKGTNTGANTDLDGKYSIVVVPGNYIVQFSFVGYESVDVPVTVISNETVTVNQALGSAGYKLEDVVIKATVSREKETALLLEQKNAIEFKASIGAAELSRKGVSDVATAVTKISGVSKQEGSGNIFVRGLGDRYNITTLNGLPLPSNNPSNKNINLEIFNTDIVESVGISKTFEAQNYADFGGANIDIISKKFSGSPYLNVGVSVGANSNVIGLDHFYLQDGPSYLGFKKVSEPSSPLQPYNYPTSWDRQEDKNTLNNNYSLSAGKKFSVGDESSLSTFFTASFDAKNNYTEGYNRGSLTSDGDANADFYRKSYKHNTNTTVMGTADYKINSKNSILFTSLFLNSSVQDYSEYEGTNVNFDGGGNGIDQISGFIKRGSFDKTQLLVNQLLGKNKFNDQWNLNWAVGYSILNNTIPDRMQNSFVHAPDGTSYTFFTNSNIYNHRFFQDLDEKELSANVAVSYNFNKKGNDDKYKGKLTLGYSGKMKNVDYLSNQYSFFPDRNNYSFTKEEIHNVDHLLSSTQFGSAQSNKLQQSYNGNLDIHSVFANVQYELTDKLSIILGSRVEQTTQNVSFYSAVKPNGQTANDSKTNILPSLISKYKVNDKQNIKFAFSKTYTLPQFKEKVEIVYEDVAQAYVGNKDLYASTNYNADLGWEFFPKNGELVAVTAFGKIIQNPINEIFLNSSSNDISYANTGKKATVLGVEVELRKDIFETKSDQDLKTKLSFGVNGSYLHHNQDLDNNKVNNENAFGTNFTFTESKLTGASDFLANADISFLKEFAEHKDITATVSYAYFSDKLAILGTSRVGNMVDKAVNRLDFILKSSLTKNIKVGVSYKNILNPIYKRVLEQGEVPGKSAVGDVLVNTYKLGSDLSLSLNYTF